MCENEKFECPLCEYGYIIEDDVISVRKVTAIYAGEYWGCMLQKKESSH